MGHVMTGFTMSLDGFVAGPGDDFERLFRWYAAGDTEYVYPNPRWTVRVSAASAALLHEMSASTGAIVTGRRLFDMTDGWGGRHPMDVPIVVVTHRGAEDWVAAHPDAPFTFVTEGVEAAIEQARVLAGDKAVAIGGADVAQQALRAGLVDEIGVELVPALLGTGVPFFANLGPNPIELESTLRVGGQGVTHLRYRVVQP